MKSICLLQPTIVRFLKERNIGEYNFLNKQFACFVYPYDIVEGSGSGSSSLDFVQPVLTMAAAPMLTAEPVVSPYDIKDDVLENYTGYDDEVYANVNAPMLYLVLSGVKTEAETDKLYEFIVKALANSSVWYNGIIGFKPGVDFFINETLNAKLRLSNVRLKSSYVLPDILTNDDTLSDNWELSKAAETEALLSSVASENDVLELQYTEEELKDFYVTFINQLLERTQIDDETRATGNNPIYDIVLKYYQNHKADEASKNIGMLLKSLITTNTTTSGCGCSMTSSTSTDTTSCADMYSNAMANWLIEMLGNTTFYFEWFNETANNTFDANEPLCVALLLLIDEFVKLGLDLSFSTTSYTMCKCPNVSADKSAANYEIIANYRKVLEWVKAGQICENKNKIKVYGEAFAALLPKLQF